MLLTFLVLVSSALARGKPFRKWSPGVYPDPQQDVFACGRDGRKSSICDPENILGRESANMVDGLINEIAEGTSPFRTAQCGASGQKGFQVGKEELGNQPCRPACISSNTAMGAAADVIVVYPAAHAVLQPAAAATAAAVAVATAAASAGHNQDLAIHQQCTAGAHRCMMQHANVMPLFILA